MNEEFEMMTPQPVEGTISKEKLPHKWRKRIGKCLLLLAVLFAGFIGGIVFLISGSNSNINNLSILKKLLVLEGCVEQYYLDEVDGEKMETGIYRGYLSGLSDPYSTYYTKEEYDQMMEEDSGEYVGIGITVMKDTTTGYVSIEQVQKDAPAYNAGIQPGDLLIEVDGNDTTTLSLQEAVNLIK
ncbi:MAG: PDZ domain-containing protein, partial [Anaerobutyricum sp.]|nr:PDZ domain-containing protein [Anaerobutyricum sp.]